MNNRKLVIGAALAALVGAGCSSTGSKSADGGMAPSAGKGECYGVNACKGQGACHGDGHGCAGGNACKGKGWVELSQADCTAKGGTFKGQ